jgi:hypothetical protein
VERLRRQGARQRNHSPSRGQVATERSEAGF